MRHLDVLTRKCLWAPTGAVGEKNALKHKAPSPSLTQKLNFLFSTFLMLEPYEERGGVCGVAR